MKLTIYICTIDDVYGFETNEHEPVVKTSRKEADEWIRQQKEGIRDLVKRQRLDKHHSNGKNGFEYWQNGCWPENHYAVSVTKASVSVPDKKRR